MIKIYNLTDSQEYRFKMFEQGIVDKEIILLSSRSRGIGKTITLNELGFTYQALGYKVYLLTNPNDCVEHITTNLISASKDKFKGISNDKTVILVDEFPVSEMDELVEYCEEHLIPIVGFVRFK